MASNVTISVNGDAMGVPFGTTVAALLQLLDVETAQIAVEFDGNVAQREHWRDILITPGAMLEIVRRRLVVFSTSGRPESAGLASDGLMTTAAKVQPPYPC